MDALVNEPLDFSITRLPFFLRPELPRLKPGDERSFGTWGEQMDGYTRKHPEKFGGQKQAPDARAGISWQAAEVGIEFTFSQAMSSSMDALRLLMKVQRERPEARERFFEIVSRKYFSEGRALSDHAMLLEAAEEAQISTEGLAAWLASEEGAWEIQRKYAEIFFGWGYTSVPVTLVSCEGVDQHIQGSQNLEAYLQVFRRLLDEPLPSKSAEQKLPIWEKMSRVAAATGTPHGKDFAWEARDIFEGATAERLRQGVLRS